MQCVNYLISRFALPLLLIAAWAGGAQAAAPSNPFAQRVLRSMEYIDFPDILVAVAANNTQPWLRYDEGERYAGRSTPLEPRWNRAITMPLSGPISRQLNDIHDVFMETAAGDFRETPIDDAGGDIDRDQGGPGGFDRLTLEEASELAANPLLTVELKDDPGSSQTQLARYRYPSAGTYHRFESLLSPQLRADLQRAEQSGKLAYDLRQPRSVGPEFRALNKRILAELLEQAFNPQAAPEDNYQAMIAVHPFDDYNGRSLRAWYRQQAHRPMFLMNFYCDLYCSRFGFESEIAAGNQEYDLVVSGLAREEQASPGYPRYYDIPQFWMAAEGRTDLPADPARFTALSKQWILQVGNAQRIDHKLFGEVIRDFKSYLESQGF